VADIQSFVSWDELTKSRTTKKVPLCGAYLGAKKPDRKEETTREKTGEKTRGKMREKRGEIKNLRKFYGILAYIKKK